MSIGEIPDVITTFFATSSVPLTLSDPKLPEDPLIHANDAFLQMSGYDLDEVLGANCRFMQGQDTQLHIRRTIKEGLSSNSDTTVLIRNYRKSGEAFDNFLYIFTVLDENDAPIFRIGSQFEVPEVNRNAQFEAHADNLRRGLATLTDTTEEGRRQFIKNGEMVGLSIKSLLTARLEALKFG